jgi:deoxyribonuclease V
MNIDPLHRWPRTTRAAIALQRTLAPRVDLRPLTRSVRLIGGADVAFSLDGMRVIAGVIVWDRAEQVVVERRVATRPVRFPYVPGLLSFRETPAVLAALRKLRCEPEVLLCDAQGLAHPRRMGLACHVGLWLARPTIGCAKSRLCGAGCVPGPRKGEQSPLMLDGEQVGVVLRTRDHVKPLYVSPGHLCRFADAARVTLEATTRYRLPEPTRLAHQLVTAERQRARRGA